MRGVRVTPRGKVKVGDGWVKESDWAVAHKCVDMYGSADEAIRCLNNWLERIQYHRGIDAYKDGNMFFDSEYVEFQQEVIQCLTKIKNKEGPM